MSTKTRKKIKILFIEDEKRWQKILLDALASEPNFQVSRVVENGQQALDYLSFNAIDLMGIHVLQQVLRLTCSVQKHKTDGYPLRQ